MLEFLAATLWHRAITPNPVLTPVASLPPVARLRAFAHVGMPDLADTCRQPFQRVRSSNLHGQVPAPDDLDCSIDSVKQVLHDVTLTKILHRCVRHLDPPCPALDPLPSARKDDRQAGAAILRNSRHPILHLVCCHLGGIRGAGSHRERNDRQLSPCARLATLRSCLRRLPILPGFVSLASAPRSRTRCVHPIGSVRLRSPALPEPCVPVFTLSRVVSPVGRSAPDTLTQLRLLQRRFAPKRTGSVWVTQAFRGI